MNINLIQGVWLLVDGKIERDAAGKKIRSMLKNDLTMVNNGNGWTRLYVDQTGVYWELTHPQGELQGGGPPQLEQLSLPNPDAWKPQ